jgi:sterol desaturase/sphingolipid hydroxylase (fatty acid hydroxylase superfamily)
VDRLTEFLTHPGYRTFLPYLGVSFFAAVVITLWQRKAKAGEAVLAHVFPGDVYRHPSARLDFVYAVLNTLLRSVLLVPFIALTGIIATGTMAGLEQLCGTRQGGAAEAAWPVHLAYSFVVILAVDFGMWLAHWLQHEIPFLWHFHKVHHSAEVLVPATAFRFHPLDDMGTAALVGVFGGLADGTFRYLIFPDAALVTIAGINVFLFAFYLAFYHLRHSHVWLSYGAILSRIFVSPAQHQIHHSKARPHWNKNYGFTFALWDWLFGSLYVPRTRETIEFGIGDGSEGEHSSVLRLLWTPIRDSARSLRHRN